MTGLYVHVPFCARRCHYCDFVLEAGAPRAARARYLDAIAREAAWHAPAFADRAFDTLYFGGGTPSMLDEAETERLFAALRGAFSFASGAEVTWEANPGDVTPAKAELYRKLGVTRASVGAQSFDDATLRALNRKHTAADTRRTVAALRAAGFDNVSLDLMIGLPGQTREAALASAREAAALGPEHASLYELTVEEGTVFGVRRRAGALELPDEDEALAALAGVRAALEEAGLAQYELLNHARPGRRSRHNRLYWDGEDVLALGPGAWANAGGRRWRTAASLERWLAKVETGDRTPDEEETLDPVRREHEALVLALRLVEGADEARFARALARAAASAERLVSEGLLERAGGRVRLTVRGRLFAETAFSMLSLPDDAVVKSREGHPMDEAKAEYERAAGLFAAGRVEDAAKALETLIGRWPGHADAYESLGMALYRLGRLDEAIAWTEKLAALKPEHAMAHTNLSVFYLKKGMKEKAEEEKAKAVVLSFGKKDR